MTPEEFARTVIAAQHAAALLEAAVWDYATAVVKGSGLPRSSPDFRRTVETIHGALMRARPVAGQRTVKGAFDWG